MDSKGKRRVRVEAQHLGMTVSGVIATWADHGLWRRHFAHGDPQTLAMPRQSGVAACGIDPIEAVPPSMSAALIGVSPAPAPGLALTTSSFALECARCEPLCRQAFRETQRMLDGVRHGQRLELTGVQAVIEHIADSVQRQASAFISMVRPKTGEDDLCMHAVAVCGLMVALATEMGLPRLLVLKLGLGGLLHDTGKALLPSALLTKTTALSVEEHDRLRAHASRGHAALVAAGLLEQEALDICLGHHERLDGTGYPQQLRGEQISLAARMAAICDVYDAFTSARPHRQACDPSVALRTMASRRGQFDRTLLALFVHLVGVYPVGSLVRLNSGEIGVVSASQSGVLYRPTVKVFYSTHRRQRIPTRVVDLSSDHATQRIEAREPRQGWNAGFLESLLDLAPHAAQPGSHGPHAGT